MYLKEQAAFFHKDSEVFWIWGASEEDNCSNTGKSFKKFKRSEDDKKEYRVHYYYYYF